VCCSGDKIVAWKGGGGRGEAYAGFWWGNLRERDHLEDPGIDGRIILRWIPIVKPTRCTCFSNYLFL
jgi:hypothetical protein